MSQWMWLALGLLAVVLLFRVVLRLLHRWLPLLLLALLLVVLIASGEAERLLNNM